MNSLLIILVCGAVAVSAVPFRQLKCDQDDLKRCEALRPFNSTDDMFPSDPDALDAQCRNAEPSLECFSEVFEMCPQIVPQPSRRTFFATKDLFDRVCKQGHFRNAYLYFAQCMGEVFKRDQPVCAKEAEAKEKLGSCAFYGELEKCMLGKSLLRCSYDSRYIFTELFNVIKTVLEDGKCNH